MGANGGKWGDMGGNGGDIGHSIQDVGCGGLWRDVVEKNGAKMGEKWDETPIFQSPPFPIFPEVEDIPKSSLCKNELTALTNGKKGIFATHRHSPPRHA